MRYFTLVSTPTKVRDRLTISTKQSKSYWERKVLEEYVDLHEWQVHAIKEGIKAAKKGEVIPLEKVKQYWEKV
ncbi:MAG TPA: hypothetical protein VHZ76_03165 [Gammaproteobacteria bacterium]|jgi:predicted transcriptional regulator|nr:hypothetical protein [Gammaproteobacteria bacterium]